LIGKHAVLSRRKVTGPAGQQDIITII